MARPVPVGRAWWSLPGPVLGVAKPTFPPAEGSLGGVSPLAGDNWAAAWPEAYHRLSPQYQKHPLPVVGPRQLKGWPVGRLRLRRLWCSHLCSPDSEW